MSARVTGADREVAEAIYEALQGGTFPAGRVAAIAARHREQSTAELVDALRGLVAAVNTNELAAAMACHSVASFANVEDALKPALAILAKHAPEPTDADLLDQVCRSADEALKPLGEVGRG